MRGCITAYTAILVEMTAKDPFSSLLSRPELAQAAQRVADALAKVHRRPAGLRKFEVISSESLMRGARAGLVLDGHKNPRLDDVELAANAELGRAVSAYSLLAPEKMSTTVRTFARAPLQVLSQLAVSAGGSGKPAGEAEARRVQGLAWLIAPRPAGAGADYDRALPLVVHAEIAAHGLFGAESGVVARVASRVAAVHTGLDPRGFGVPETWLVRHRQAYAQALESYAQGRPDELLELLCAAWEAGAKEADGIAASA